MGIFGKNNNKKQADANPTNPINPANVGQTGQHDNAGTGQYDNAGSGVGNQAPTDNTQPGPRHHHHHQHGGGGGELNTRDYAGGPNTGYGAGGNQGNIGGYNAVSDPHNQPVGQSSVPPAGTINDGSRSSRGGGRTVGRVEQAVGSMVGSQALKEKGLLKEQEAGAFKAQSAEIGEAERLEREAVMRRERAVAHGAHPDNKYLGGRQGGPTGGSREEQY
ncbi:hypothetical protein BKA93DRAFT_826886 [Sparassis latifolia]